MRNIEWIRVGFFALSLIAAGCGDSDDDDGGSVDVDAGIQLQPEPIEKTCTAATLGCTDEAILQLSLHGDKVSEGEVTNTQNGGVFESVIDATAGGFLDASDNPYLYLKFTYSGLEKVEIDDETAFTSQQWQIAAKRFVLRLNGGASGPSCVGAAMLEGETFENVSAVPAGTTFENDGFFDSECAYVNDGIGVGFDGPDTALNGWWSYPNCVATTGTPAIIQLDDGRTVRFVVDEYYGMDQAQCNDSSMAGSDGANLKVRWSFLD